VQPTDDENDYLITLGPLEIDWPKSLGYFGGVALAVAYDRIPGPLGLFIAAVPLVKLFKDPNRSWPLRIIADAVEGAAKPVGGDAEATVRLSRRAARRDHRTASRPPSRSPLRTKRASLHAATR